jgi:urea transport system ATP-binding protein
VLSVEHLDVGYGRTQVLFGVSLEVPAGSLACLMGRNGMGKTTLLNAVMGLLRPRAGRVLFDGRDITRTPTHERVRAGLGYVPQGHEAFPQLTVEENLLVVAEADGRRVASAVDRALAVFPRLVPLLGRRAGVLSGGQRQQLAIARALVTQPRLLLLDEPTEGIQPSIILEIEDAIRALRADGLTILLVEQYVEFALGMADRFAVLDAGRVARTGDAGALDDSTLRELLAV